MILYHYQYFNIVSTALTEVLIFILVVTLVVFRFRRDVLEGTFEEMTEPDEAKLREKRQAEFPGNPEQDETK